MDIIMIFVEMILNILLYNNLFNNDNKQRRIVLYIIIAAICSVLFYNFKNINGILVYIILLILEIVAISYVDKKNNILVLTELVICIIFNFILQNGLVTIVYLLTGIIKYGGLLHFIIYIFSMIFVMKFCKHYKNKKNINFEKYVKNNLLISNIILNIFILFMILKTVYNTEGGYSDLVIEINIFIVLNIFLNIGFYKTLYKIILKNKNIEIKSAYNLILDEIIQNMKANEHEYKNHINMIYSMIQVSKSIPEIKERAGSYIVNIQNNNLLSKILEIDSTVVKAVLYSKLVECEQLGINLSYNIKANIEDSNLDDTEITIILSNLLNNAIEASKKSNNKNIILDIRKFERYKIEIKNDISGLNIDSSEVDNFFKKGYSTKDKGRGYGLFNVKKIIKKHKGTIYARVVEEFLAIDIYI